MKLALRRWIVLISLTAMAFPAAVCAQNRDEAAVRGVAMQQADAWNKHDATAYSALFTPDCDVVNVAGWWWKSSAEMQQKLAREFATIFAHSTLTFTDVQVKFLKPDIAVAHARWSMTGEEMPPGMPRPDQGIQTLVMTKHAGKWLIAEFQNTVSHPERPFPTKSASAPASAASVH